MTWYIHPSKQLRDDELPPELVVTNRDGTIEQVYVPERTCHMIRYDGMFYVGCSECDNIMHPADKYCWYCGAKVVGE